MAPEPTGQAHESKRAVIAAFAANIGIGVMKFARVPRSPARARCCPKPIHSVADAGNQGLLLIGRAHARRPPNEQHPFGYGPLRYFYAFIVAVVLFTAGGLFSIYEGVDKIRHPHQLEGLGWAIAVLLGAMVMEALSFRTGISEANAVRPAGETWWQFIRHTKGPDLPVVLLEDTAALVGLVFALVGVTLAAVTDNGRWDGVGSLAIGALLVAVAIVLVVEMSSLLVGEAARPEVVARLRATIEAFPTVQRLIHLRTEHLGPDEIVVAAKIEFDPSISVPQLASEIDALEVQLRAVEPHATLIFIEPDVYRDDAPDPTSEARERTRQRVVDLQRIARVEVSTVGRQRDLAQRRDVGVVAESHGEHVDGRCEVREERGDVRVVFVLVVSVGHEHDGVDAAVAEVAGDRVVRVVRRRVQRRTRLRGERVDRLEETAPLRAERLDRRDVDPGGARMAREVRAEHPQPDLVSRRELGERGRERGSGQRDLGRVGRQGRRGAVAHRVRLVEQHQHARPPAIGLPAVDATLGVDRRDRGRGDRGTADASHAVARVQQRGTDRAPHRSVRGGGHTRLGVGLARECGERPGAGARRGRRPRRVEHDDRVVGRDLGVSGRDRDERQPRRMRASALGIELSVRPWLKLTTVRSSVTTADMKRIASRSRWADSRTHVSR